jgi:hypothetical protein
MEGHLTAHLGEDNVNHDAELAPVLAVLKTYLK